VLLINAVALAFVWAATEWTAWKLGFQSQLGHPWFEVFGWPVYLPPAFFWWWLAYDAYARDIFADGAYIAASGGIAAIVVAITMSVRRAREAKKVTTMAPRAGPRPGRSAAPACFTPRAFCSAVIVVPISAMTGRSMCCASPRRGAARVSASSCRRC
jgi:hypothetical protein